MIKLKKLLTEATFRVTFDIEDAKLGRYTTDVQAKDKKDAEKKVAAKFVGGEKLITKGKTKKIKESVVEGSQRDRNNLAQHIEDLSNMLSNAKILQKRKDPNAKKYIKLIQQDIKDAKKKIAKLKNESINENKSDKKTFDKIVKALKDIKVKATIHLNDEDKITIALGRDYFRKKNPEGNGDLSDMVEDRLKKAGIQKGYNLPPGVDIMADSSDIGDRKYTKAQQNIRGGV
tara:strand:- start:267 stop:959 length:693 start_codon:yes stop_codon:yes gene_type:complete